MHELRTLLPFFRAYRRPMAWGLVLVVVSNLFSVAAPWLVKLAIDALADPGVTRGRIAAFALALVGTTALSGVAKYGMRELLNGVSRRIEVDLRDRFFGHLLTLDQTFYGGTRTGDLMSRATNDTMAVRMAAGPAIMYAVNTVVGFAFALAVMLWISPRLTLFALVPMLLLPPLVLRFGQAIHRRFEDIQERFAALSTMVQENLTGVRIVRAYTQEEGEERRFDALNRDYLRHNMELARIAGLFHPLLFLVAGSAMVVVLWAGGLEVVAGRISVGDFVAFTIYLGYLMWPMIALGWVVSLFQRGAASMGRLNRILEARPAVEAPPSPRTPPAANGRVEFRDVSFRYPGTERDVLRGVSFVAEPGATVAVVGPTGSGKSTLVRLIPRLYDATEGEVLVDDVPVSEQDPGALRARIGMVPQDPFLFSATLRENIALGLGEEADEARVVRAATVAQLDETIRGFPAGYDTLLGERGINLSGGQKQRATLARAIAREPRVLILDDALSAVDTHTEARILADLRSVMAGRTAFIISHRVSAVMEADLILVLEEGRVVERGTHAQLLAQDGVYARLLRRQMLEEGLEERRRA